MASSPKKYQIIHAARKLISVLPGRYAGNTTHKIFGRLDCKSGMRMHKENRVFFLTWDDAIAEGYRPCQKCKPTPNDLYPDKEKLAQELEAQPHIALWKSGPPPNIHRPEQAWYICLNWQEVRDGKRMSCQVILSEPLLFTRARRKAGNLGKKYNLPILKQNVADFTVMWAPSKEPDDSKRKAVENLQKSDKAIKLSWML